MAFIATACALSLTACREKFLPSAPFSEVRDTVNLGLGNWYFQGTEAEKLGSVSAYPFAYQIFNGYFSGFILHSDNRIYLVEKDRDLDRRILFLDKTRSPGDTLFRYHSFRFHLLIDKTKDDKTQHEVYYVLRKNRLGEKKLQERSVWVISEQKGILAAADCDVDNINGDLTLNITGDPEYFASPALREKIRFHFYEQTRLYDTENEVIYEFDKVKGYLKKRDVRARADLEKYEFAQFNTRSLTDFHLSLSDEGVTLTAGDSCFHFTTGLELRRSGLCNP